MTNETDTHAVSARHAETFAKGSVVTYDGQLYRVECLVDFKTTVGTELESARAQALPVADVRVAPHGNDEAQGRRQPLDALSDEDWKQAWERLDAIHPLLKMQRYGRADVDRRAAEVERSANTLYTWIARYRDTNDLTVLVPGQRG